MEHAPPDSAAAVFGDRLPLAERYVHALATTGVHRGLLGPREVPRLWERHVLNCAAVAPLVPQGAAVVDVGSGAGLPGIPLALARPDLDVVLLEPLLRRTTWLQEVVDDLALARVHVERGRAEDVPPDRTWDVATARAVAPLPRLLGWCVPLVRVGGLVLALKGSTAAQELADAGGELARSGSLADVVVCDPLGSGPQGAEAGAAATVVRVRVGDRSPARRVPRRGGRRR